MFDLKIYEENGKALDVLKEILDLEQEEHHSLLDPIFVDGSKTPLIKFQILVLESRLITVQAWDELC